MNILPRIWKRTDKNRTAEKRKEIYQMLIHIWLVSEFTFTENSHAKAIFNISQNHVVLQFYYMNSCSHQTFVISLISREITLDVTSFSPKIRINWENCQLSFTGFIFHANDEKWNEVHAQFTEILVTTHHYCKLHSQDAFEIA